MRTTAINGHSVELYDSIEELPITRYQKYSKMLLVDSGVGSDMAAFDQRIEKARRYCMAGKPDMALKELDNLRQCVFLVQSELSPKHLAFAALVRSVDGKPCDKLTDEALKDVAGLLGGATGKEMTEQFDSVKKKIDSELATYFPEAYSDASVKEYYGLLRKRTLAVLGNIVSGDPNPAGAENVDKLTTELMTFANPKAFTGADNAEIQFERNFENLCLMLSGELHVEPKKFTVLEFYNAFEFLKERAKATETAQKRPKNAR